MKARWRDIVYAPPSPRELELLAAAKGRRDGGGDAAAGGTQRATRRLEAAAATQPAATQATDAARWIAAWRWQRAADAAGVRLPKAVAVAGVDDDDGFWDDAELGGEGAFEDETEWTSGPEAKAQQKEFRRFMKDIGGN